MARILVIDDEAELLEVLQSHLQSAGHEVFSATTAQAGLALYHANRPEIVISDLFLPDSSGLHLVMELSRNQGTPLIAISGGPRGNMDLLEAAEMFGAFRSLAKPIRREALLAIVEEALATRNRRSA